jgi:glutathione S-transferase
MLYGMFTLWMVIGTSTIPIITGFIIHNNKLPTFVSPQPTELTIPSQNVYDLKSVTTLDMSSRNDDVIAMDTSTLTLYGHPGTRSPLINWACYELGFDISMASDLSQNPHPFGQIPCLTDNNNVLVFESGAILQYLHQYYSTNIQLSKEQSAAITSWIIWANASLDPICFLETPNGKVYDTGLRQPNRRIDQLNTILSKQSFLISSKESSIQSSSTGSIFTIADVAIVSYLAYVLQFFPDVTIADKWPYIALYMQTCISRSTYGQAFGSNVQSRLLTILKTDIAKAEDNNSSTGNKDKKLFGMF